MSSFDLLAPPIRRLLAERGFDQPTLPQERAIPEILKGKNVLLIAPAGSGKTEAAFLPVLHQMLYLPRERGIKLLYITPLRALNRDMLERLEWWCKSLDFRISVRHGDTEARERRIQALVPPDIMITTPETFQILLLGRRLSEFLKPLRWVVVDEVHELAESKRGAQLSLTLERLREVVGRELQLVGLSATIGSPEEVARFLVGVGRPCEVLDVSVAKRMEIEVVYPRVRKEDVQLAEKLYSFPEVAARLRAMRELMEGQRSVLIFTNTRPMAEILSSRFRLWDVEAPLAVHHGSLSGAVRVRAEKALKAGEIRYLICTSSLELGLDIGTVDLVIQYNSPRQVTRLVQRVGRAGHRLTEVSRGRIVALDPEDALESIVIAAKARRGELEPVKVPEKPLDVLLHSLVALLGERRTVSVEQALKIFRRAHPFRNLTREDILRVLEFAQSLERRLLRVSDGEYSRPLSSQRTFNYYYQNLSMIPELKQYLVVEDETSNPVGILDESFVAEYGEPGTKFIMAGRPWRILQIFRDRIYVKKEEDPLGCVPTWIGEEIPVPFSVAQEVGRIRSRVEREGAGVLDHLAQEYSVAKEVLESSLGEVLKQAEEGIPLPTESRITVEQVGEFCVVGACFGSLVNRTLARLMAHLLSELTGGSVAITTDPYKIVLRSELLNHQQVLEILRNRPLEELRSALKEAVERSHFFAWRLVQVAKRMGVLDREAEITAPVVQKLQTALRATPAHQEAYREVVEKDLDVEQTFRVLEKIREGEVEVVDLGKRKEPTPVASLFWKQPAFYLEPVAPKRMRALILASARARLVSEVRVLACVECLQYVEEKKMYELDERPSCPLCGSRRLGMADSTEEEVREALELRRKGRSTKLWRELLGSAKLLERGGKLAALALAGRGVRPEAAQRILSAAGEFGDRFIELVVEEERRALFRSFLSGRSSLKPE
ncbi:MAG: DEAD/DEAH box helicase [Candidatus Hadarchaeales archaeon]